MTTSAKPSSVISAWQIAKLDSKEAVKAAAKARASSSVLRPLSSRHRPYEADHLSGSNVSGRSNVGCFFFGKCCRKVCGTVTSIDPSLTFQLPLSHDLPQVLHTPTSLFLELSLTVSSPESVEIATAATSSIMCFVVSSSASNTNTTIDKAI
ncbi:hypothetical protein Sjap_005449 [Stephania japonica]|uniref:Uncharacterized protein n=1 Tax=Stephania japonica TaxID=461633 RepID=A0AAP0K3Z7_9MAGN